MASFFRKNIGWITILLLAFLPVARWVELLPLNYRFFDLSVTMTSFGQITGLVGMAMFSVSLILGARLKFLDNYFYGLDRVYQNHHIIGAVSFSLLLFHPLFLVFKYVQFSLRDAALFFLPSVNQAMNYGIISLFLMMVLMIMTFYISLKYQRWKFFHKFMVVVFIFAILHSYYTVSDISRDFILRFYILGLAGAGLVGGIWRIYLERFLNSKFDYEIKKVIKPRPDVFEIEMVPKNRVLEFEPGQFIFIKFISQKITRESHPFSIASAPGDTSLKLVVKSLGDFTSELGNLQAGDRAIIEGPFGKFSYKDAVSRDQIWIAGGIGITPFLSMAKSLKNTNYKIDLYYSLKSKNDAVLFTELYNIAFTNKNFKIIPWYTDEKGYVNAQIISKTSEGLDGKEIFLCGPPAFMESLNGQFRKMGIGKERIHWENFNFK